MTTEQQNLQMLDKLSDEEWKVVQSRLDVMKILDRWIETFRKRKSPSQTCLIYDEGTKL